MFTAAVLLFSLATASAPVLLRALSEEELIRGAERILIGEVIGLRGHWNSERSRIFTRVELRLTRILKGPQRDPIAVIQILGGSVGSLTTEVGGAPSFALGESVLVFTESLEENGWRYETVRGWALGKFRLEPGGGAAPTRLVRELEGIEFRGGARPAEVLLLEQLESAIRAQGM
ncbi:MAG TPA: hypothetical protein VGB99_13585 [Acidobacteriota bacterium]